MGDCGDRELTQTVRLVGILINAFILAGTGVLLFILELSIVGIMTSKAQGVTVSFLWAPDSG